MPAKYAENQDFRKPTKEAVNVTRQMIKYIAKVTSQKLIYRARGTVFKVRGPVTTSFEVGDGGGGANLVAVLP